MGHRISEHDEQIKPIRSGEELLERIPVIANMTTIIVGHKGAKPLPKMPRIDFNLDIIFRVDWELLFAGGTENFLKIVQWSC